MRRHHELNDAVSLLATTGRRVKDLYRPINDILHKLVGDQHELLTPLRELASIRQFDLFATTTPDNLLAQALNVVRFDGLQQTDEIEYAPKLHTRKDVQRLDTATWTLKRPVLAGAFDSLAMSPDGHNLAGFDRHSGRGHHYITLEQVWDVDTGTELAWREGGRTDADDPASRPARSGRQALIDEAKSWIPIPSKGVSPHGVWRVDLDRYSSTLPLQEVISSRTIERFEHDANLVDAAFSPRGRWLASSSADGTVRLWPLQAPDLIEMACKLLSHHPTSNEAAAARLAKACPPAKP